MTKRDWGYFALGFGISALVTIWFLYSWYIAIKIDNPFFYSMISSIAAIALIIIGIYKTRK
jgi:hypothetical protein